METLTIYVLRQETYFVSYDIFTEKDDRYYIQYKKKGEDKYTSKHGTLEELVGEYEYGDEKMTVELITKTIEI